MAALVVNTTSFGILPATMMPKDGTFGGCDDRRETVVPTIDDSPSTTSIAAKWA